MLRFKVLASVVPLMAAAVLARGGPGTPSHPCIVVGETPVELASVPWSAGLHVAFTDDPAHATVRVQITETAEAADFVLVDDGPTAETDACQASAATRLVAISAHPSSADPVIYLFSAGPADYHIYVRSKTFSARDAAALIVGAAGEHRHLQAASL
ncbi:hypothetical protein QA640_00865 [Bradyrhizobium sp. CB82]|uniref:hypothetical protein n=1 Tax=Bradyrhizobium sp. CB82 TaxID=3039159 RepID=UPI0024B267AB|nr:hypothetical protein [Bradyrhizobium sp. CB82]WFU41132.1 hypothetical protein QA640_00865 [Bradyrhizobium sp. CB82]